MYVYYGPVSRWDACEKAEEQAAKVVEGAGELFLAVKNGNERTVIEAAAYTVETVAGLLHMYGIRMFENDMDRLFITHVKRNRRKDV